jgi:hypothetical protein
MEATAAYRGGRLMPSFKKKPQAKTKRPAVDDDRAAF